MSCFGVFSFFLYSSFWDGWGAWSVGEFWDEIENHTPLFFPSRLVAFVAFVQIGISEEFFLTCFSSLPDVFFFLGWVTVNGWVETGLRM